ncbi:MAG: 30S ribosomal protein S13 [Nanoarchaeota archaeon]|nr:30S ribosomal protein S13 [Nanoarchaeota archaeon]
MKDKKEIHLGESIIRILSTDIPGNKNIYSGITRIRGISWSLSNAICNKLKIDKNKKISELSKKEIEDISKFIKSSDIPEFVLNRRKDFESGKSEHLIGTELELKEEFDIKRMKKIKSYKGVRHITGRPVRGQRTKSHFRKNKTLGVSAKKVKNKGS